MREQGSDINNEPQHENIFVYNGNSQECLLKLCKNQYKKKQFVFLEWKAAWLLQQYEYIFDA